MAQMAFSRSNWPGMGRQQGSVRDREDRGRKDYWQVAGNSRSATVPRLCLLSRPRFI